MKFFNIDFHASIIADISRIFKDLGHDSVDWTLSGHAWIFNKQKANIPVLNDWQNMVSKELWNDFYKIYSNELNQYDSFITCYPPSFSLLYKKFEKPIIMHMAIRYEHPFTSNPGAWGYLNNYVREGVDAGKIILVANSIYDKKYCESFVGREVRYIPSLCDYADKYNGKKDGFIYFSRNPIPNVQARHWNQRYHFNDLANYSGIIHFPYQISTMSIFEQYTSNIPLFFPSQEYLLSLYQTGYNVLKELSWTSYFNLSNKSPIKYQAPYDPNDYKDIAGIRHWLQYADFYSEFMPHINYFNSIEELNDMIEKVDLSVTSQKMREKNIERKEYVYKSWEEVIKLIK